MENTNVWKNANISQPGIGFCVMADRDTETTDRPCGYYTETDDLVK